MSTDQGEQALPELSRDDSGRGFLIEWNGEHFDSLLQIKRGKPQYITADGRTLKRCRVIGALIRPSTDPADRSEVDQPETVDRQDGVGSRQEQAASTATTETPSVGDTRPDITTHWASSGGAAARTQAAHHPDGSATHRTLEEGHHNPIPQGGVTETTPGQWTGVDDKGDPIVVWSGEPAVDDIDQAIAYQQAILGNLQQLRSIAVSRARDPRQTAIGGRVRTLAAADGVHDLADATPEQLEVWRRYAEALEQ